MMSKICIYDSIICSDCCFVFLKIENLMIGNINFLVNYSFFILKDDY